MKIEWTTDEDGMLVGARYHDGTLWGLTAALRDGRVELLIEGSNGVSYSYALVDVSILRIDEFWESNLVSDIFVYSASSAPKRAVLELYKGRVQSEELAYRELAKDSRDYLFELGCCYGAHVYALCNAIEISEKT